MEDFAEALEADHPGVLQGKGDALAIWPRTREELGRALALATERELRLSAPGGAVRGLPIDLRRMAEVLTVDELSLIVHTQAGATVAAVEHELLSRGLTLGLQGDLPDGDVGAWLARGAPGARCPDNDPVDQLVAGMDAVLPDGRALTIRPAPRRAVGPDIVSAMVGARGRLGIITAVHLVARARKKRKKLAFLFAARLSAEAARAWLRGRGARPVVADVVETSEGAALLLVLEGDGAVGEAQEKVARDAIAERGGVELDLADAPASPRPEAPPLSAIVEELASHLDPSGVLAGAS